MDQNIIQKAISNVKNTAKKIVDFSFNTPGVGFQRIGQEIRKDPSQFFIGSELARGKATTGIKPIDLNISKPIGQASVGAVEGLSLGLIRPDAPQPMTGLEKIGRTGGYLAGAFAPVGLGAKVLAPLGIKTEAAIASKLGQNVPKILAKGIPILGGELAQSAAYVGAKRLTGQQDSLAQDLAFGLGMRGVTGLGIRGLSSLDNAFNLRNVPKPKVELNGKQAKQIRDAIDRFSIGEVKFDPNKSAIDREMVKTVMNVARKQAPEHFKTGKVTFEQALQLANQALKEHQSINYPMVGRGNQIPGMNLVGKSKGLTPEVKQPIKIYRGGTSDSKYYSTSKNIAEDFAKNRGGSVVEKTLSPNAKIISYEDIPTANFKGINDYNMESFGSGKDLLSFQNGKLEADYIKAENWAKQNGYDAVKFPTEGEIRVINPKALSGLTPEVKIPKNIADIKADMDAGLDVGLKKFSMVKEWERRNLTPEVNPLIQEAKKYKSAEEFIKNTRGVWEDKNYNSQVVSRDFNNKLKNLRSSVSDIPSDPYYFDLGGKKAKIVGYSDLVRYGGDKKWKVEIIEGSKKIVKELYNDQVFELKPLGKIKQIKSPSGMVDIYINDPRIERLFGVIPEELKNNIKFPGTFKEYSGVEKHELGDIYKKANSLKEAGGLSSGQQSSLGMEQLRIQPQTKSNLEDLSQTYKNIIPPKAQSGLTPEVTTKVKIKSKTKPVVTQERIQLPVENISPTEKLSLPQGDYTLKQPIGETTSKYNIGRNKTVNQRVLKQALDEVAPAFEKQVGGPITHEQIIKQASEFSDDVIKTIGRKTTEDLGAAQLRLRQNIASMADTGKVTPELLEAMKTDASFARSTAQLLGQRAIDANPQTPFGKNMIRYVKAVNEVADNIDLVVEKAKGVDFNDIEQASTFYRQFIKPTTGDWIDKIRFSSMLSSPNTVINNLSSNFQGTGLLAPIEKIISGGIDAIVSGLTGSQRKHFAGEGVEYAKGYWSNMKTALQDFASAMKGGSDAGEMYNVKLTKKGTGGRVAEETLSFFPRLAQATDEFFSALTSGGLEKANAYRVAKGGVNQTADQIALEAKRRLFNQPFGSDQSYLLNALEYIPSKIMEATHSKNPFVRWTAKFAFPFIRIPTNVFKSGIEYSPLGIATLPGANNKIEQASKALMGTTVALGAWQLANADRLTFGMPTSEKQRDAFTAAGMQPYSIKIGDKWFSYTKFHPIVGFNMALASALKEQLDKKTLSDDQLDTVIGVASKWLTYFANQSYVKQMGDFMSLSQGNETAVGKAIGNYPSQLIPFRAFLGWLARAFDPYERKIDPNGSKLDKSLQSIMMSIPGARNTLMPRTNSQGQPVEQQNRFLNLVSPSKVTNEVPQEKQIYDALKQKSIQTSKENAIKSELKASNGNAQSLGGNRYIVIDKNTGDALTIDLSPIQKPTATGNTELDKKLFSSYNSKITSQISDVTKLYEAGQITSSKAEELIKQLQSQRLTKAKKPKKISIKKISVPKVKVSKAKKIKIKAIKVPKAKKLKIKKVKQQKLAKLKTIKTKV